MGYFLFHASNIENYWLTGAPGISDIDFITRSKANLAKQSEGFFQGGWYSAQLLVLGVGIQALVLPDSPDCWSSLMPNPSRLSLPLRVLFAFLQIYLFLLFGSNLFMYTMSSHPFFFGALDLLEILR